MKYKDDFSETFHDEHSFLGFLDQIEENAAWQSYQTNSLRIMAIKEEPDAKWMIKADSVELAEQLLADTGQNTGLLLQTEDGCYPLGSTAIKTLENRARISGYALSDLEKPVFARVINDCLNVTGGKALLRIHEGKVRAVHGGDKSDYVVLPMPQIFEAAAIHMGENYEESKFSEGFFDHSITMASWEVKDERLLQTYRELLLQYGQLADDNLAALIRIHCSDVGVSGANIFCTLLTGKERTPLLLGGALKLPHKDNASIEAFSGNVSQIFARYQEEVEGLSNLFQVYVNYPLNVMANVMKKAEIGLALRAQTVERFRASHGGSRCNGYEVYCGICECIFLAQSNGMNPRGLVDLEEKVSKCLKYRFHEYDIPGSISY